MLQILDDGRVTDAHGRSVNFENTVIVMTSNAGSDRKEASLGFNREPSAMAKEKALKALSDFLRPEFLSRIDEIVVFKALSEADYAVISVLMMNELKTSMSLKKIELRWDEALVNALVKKSFGGKFGARDLRKNVRREVEDRIAQILVDTCDREILGIALSADGETIIANAV
jgi:ATP-dependent Clp protease ATP-binding subunit ClpA